MATDNVLDRVYAGEDDTEDMEEAVWSKATSPVEYTSRSAIEADRALAEKARQEIAAAKASPKPKTAPKQPQGIPTPTPAQKTSPSITGEAAKGIPEGYSVRKGDTLSAVAKKHGLSLGQLLKLNPQIKDPDNIFIGDKINLQAPQAQTQAFEMPKGRSLDVNQPVLPLGNTAPPYKMQFGDKPLETVAPEGWALGGLRMGGALAGLLKSPASITPRALQQLNKANVGYAVGGSTMRVNPDRLAAAAKPIVKTVKVGNFNVTRRAAEAMGIQALGEVSNQTKGKSTESSQREVPDPFDKEANAAESIMGPSDIIPDIVEQSTGSELAGFASGFLSPTQAFKKAAGGVSNIVAHAKKTGVLQKVINKAKDLETSGKTQKEIFEETGLYRGPVDNEWRTVISDKDAKLKLDKFSSDASYPDYHHLSILKDVKLKEVLDHPMLFKRFPWLKDVNVRGGFLMSKGNAAYDASSNTIFTGLAHSNDFDEYLGTLLHEVQHAVQTKHGLTKGANPDLFLADPKTLTKRTQVFRDAISNAEKELEAQFPGFNRFTTRQPEEVINSPLYEELMRLLRAKQHLEDMNDRAYQTYRKVGGEAEARAVDDMFINDKLGEFVGPDKPDDGWTFDKPKKYNPSKFPLDFYDVETGDLTESPLK